MHKRSGNNEPNGKNLMQTRTVACRVAAVVLAVCIPAGGYGQDTMAEIIRYREMLKEANPAELLELEGEELWITPAGPNNVTLEKCDLGLGPGVVKGVYAMLPRYFSDTDEVQDAESRIATCMMQLQGFSREEAIREWYKPGSKNEALVTFIATQSRGDKINVPAKHPREAEMYKVSWPSRTELYRASLVVLATIFLLTIALFMFDLVWNRLFTLIGIKG